MAKKKKEEAAPQELNLKFELATVTIPVKGKTSLIMSRFSEKAKQQIQEIGAAESGIKQGGKKKNIISPEDQYANSIHYMSDGVRYGFPAIGFKAAMVDAAYRVYGRKMTDMKAFFYVNADDGDLVEIHGTPRMREDMVRVGGMTKVAAPRYRAEFPDWSANVTITYVVGAITEKELATYLQASGTCCGVGEWRPEKGGSHGMYELHSN